MSNASVERLEGAYEAFGRGDIPAVLAVLDENVQWNVPAAVPHGRKVRGRDEVAAFFGNLAAHWSDFAVDLEAWIASGDRVCVIGRAHGKHGDVETGYGFVHAWTMRDGLCVRFDEFVDPDPELLSA